MSTPIPQPPITGDLLLNPDFADLTLRCNGRDLPAHSLVVCRQSTVWTDAFLSAKQTVIEVKGTDNATMQRALAFMYRDHGISNTVEMMDEAIASIPVQAVDAVNNANGVTVANADNEVDSNADTEVDLENEASSDNNADYYSAHKHISPVGREQSPQYPLFNHTNNTLIEQARLYRFAEEIDSDGLRIFAFITFAAATKEPCSLHGSPKVVDSIKEILVSLDAISRYTKAKTRDQVNQMRKFICAYALPRYDELIDLDCMAEFGSFLLEMDRMRKEQLAGTKHSQDDAGAEEMEGEVEQPVPKKARKGFFGDFFA